MQFKSTIILLVACALEILPQAVEAKNFTKSCRNIQLRVEDGKLLIGAECKANTGHFRGKPWFLNLGLCIGNNNGHMGVSQLPYCKYWQRLCRVDQRLTWRPVVESKVRQTPQKRPGSEADLSIRNTLSVQLTTGHKKRWFRTLLWRLSHVPWWPYSPRHMLPKWQEEAYLSDQFR